MAQFNAENERMKRKYLGWQKEAEGKDEKTLDQIAASLRDFEFAIGFKSFKAFHIDWARRYKAYLEKARHHRTDKPLSLATKDARLRNVKAFFKWLADQPGYKSRVTHHDVQYFNNNAKDARAAHTRRPVRFPSMEQCDHTFGLMPSDNEFHMRDRAVFATLMLTGIRDGALASLRICDVDFIDGGIFQDGRYVRTKNSKDIDSYFLPVAAMYLDCIQDWVRHLSENALRAPTDALFPKAEFSIKNGRFHFGKLSDQPYANGQPINMIVKDAFKTAGLHQFTAHSLRKTLHVTFDRRATSWEQRKAISQNFGHSKVTTTVDSYLPVSRERQRDLIRELPNSTA